MLQAFKNNARQYNEALIEGKRRNAAVVEYTDLTGRTVRRYWTGASYEDRPSSMYEASGGRYKASGVYKAKYKE